jgi:hypothetical protein
MLTDQPLVEHNTEDQEDSDFGETGKLHAFLKGHPLYKTHKSTFDDKKSKVVPNFVGGSLPRCDRGDREYYCATMLTLFKPWRIGLDLKAENYSWDETFTSHNFTARQLEIMRYFNIRYECNDARDDYSTHLKIGETKDGIFPSWMSSDTLDNLDDEDPYGQGGDHEDEGYRDTNYGTSRYAGLGRKGKMDQSEMEAMKMSVKEA